MSRVEAVVVGLFAIAPMSLSLSLSLQPLVRRRSARSPGRLASSTFVSPGALQLTWRRGMPLHACRPEPGWLAPAPDSHPPRARDSAMQPKDGARFVGIIMQTIVCSRRSLSDVTTDEPKGSFVCWLGANSDWSRSRSEQGRPQRRRLGAPRSGCKGGKGFKKPHRSVA